MQKVGTVALWMGALDLSDVTYSVDELQVRITEFVAGSKRTVTGMYVPERSEFILLHWPDTREGYVTQSIGDCDVVLRDLALDLNVATIAATRLAKDEISCMMGLKVGGYDDGRVASLDEIVDYQGQLHMTPSHMVSARARHDGSVESYGEPTVYLVGYADSESAIHAIGDQLEQHHYGIQRGSGVTDFYETKWAGETKSE